MLKIKPFINTFTQKGKSYPSGKDDWKQFEVSNPTIPLNVLYVKKTNVYPTYIQMKSAKDNSNQENQIIILMSRNGEQWHYLAVTALLQGIMPKHDVDFYCLNCLHLFRTKS